MTEYISHLSVICMLPCFPECGWFNLSCQRRFHYSSILCKPSPFAILPRCPSGPIGIPVFGSFFQFGLDQKYFLTQRRLRDGDLSCFYLSAFAKPVILLNEPVAANDILSHKHCQDRERRTDAVLLKWPDPQSFGDVNGQEWRTRRRLFQRILIDAMNNNATYEHNAGPYIRALLQSISESDNGVVRPRKQINYTIFMNMYRNIFGGHIDADSEIFNTLFDTITRFPSVLGVFIVLSSNVTLPLFALKWLDRKLGYSALFQVWLSSISLFFSEGSFQKPPVH